MPSICSCVPWPSVHLLWRNAYSSLLPIFKLDCLFDIVLNEFFIYFGYQPLVRVYGLQIFSPISWVAFSSYWLFSLLYRSYLTWWSWLPFLTGLREGQKNESTLIHSKMLMIWLNGYDVEKTRLEFWWQRFEKEECGQPSEKDVCCRDTLNIQVNEIIYSVDASQSLSQPAQCLLNGPEQWGDYVCAQQCKHPLTKADLGLIAAQGLIRQ